MVVVAALGGALPDTTWVRTADTSGPEIFGAIPGWVQAYPLAGTSSVLLVLAGTACALWATLRDDQPWARTVIVFVGAGSIYLLVLALIRAQGADWYYGPTVACSSIAVGLAAASAGSVAARLGAVAVGVVALVGLIPRRACPVDVGAARREPRPDRAVRRHRPATPGAHGR